jgi:hypothetical protein
LDLASLITAKPSPASAWNFLFSNLKKESVASFGAGNEGYDATLSPMPCESIGDLLTAIKKRIPLSKSAEEGMILIMAVAISLKVDGPFLWTHITGPSSSLKSTLLNMVTPAYDKVYSLTDFKGFTSGSTVGGRDNSLLPQLQDKLFVIHDFTPILQGKAEMQNEVCGQFRVIYEGSYEARFKNGVVLDYGNVRFSCLTGVTYEIYAFRRTDMGERFLIFDIAGEWTDDGLHRKIDSDLDHEHNAYSSIFSTIANGLSANDSPKLDELAEQRQLAWGLMNNLMDYIEDETHGLKVIAKEFAADKQFDREISALALWMEHGRCMMAANDASYVRVSPAEPHRSIKILGKTALCLAIVLKANGLTEQIRNIVRKLAFDSGKSFSLEIMNYLALHPVTSKHVLASRMNLSGTWVGKHCDHLISIGVIRAVFRSNGQGSGRDVQCFELTPKFRAIADLIGLKAKSAVATSPLNAVVMGTIKPPPFGRKTP